MASSDRPGKSRHRPDQRPAGADLQITAERTAEQSLDAQHHAVAPLAAGRASGDQHVAVCCAWPAFADLNPVEFAARDKLKEQPLRLRGTNRFVSEIGQRDWAEARWRRQSPPMDARPAGGWARQANSCRTLADIRRLMIQPSIAQAPRVITVAITCAAVTKPPNTPSARGAIPAPLNVLLTTD